MMFGPVGADALLVVALLFAIVAFFYSNLGLGGGQLYVPIMVLFFSSLHMKEIVPLSLAFAFATMLTSTYSHSKKGLVDFKLGAYLAAAGLVGVAVGTLFTTNADEDLVKASFATMLVIVASKMIYDIYRKKNGAPVAESTSRGRMLSGLGVSVLTGVLVGSFGVGGGVVSVPLIIYVFRLDPRKAIGTSAMLGAILTPAAFVVYVLEESVSESLTIHYDLIMVLVPLVFVFAYVGSKWGLEKLKTKVVLTIFTCGVYLAAIGMIYSVLFT